MSVQIVNEHEMLLHATAEMLRKRRMDLGISQEELSMRSGLHRTYISDIELGKRNISLMNLSRLATALQLPASELLKLAQERVQAQLSSRGQAVAGTTFGAFQPEQHFSV